MEKIVAFALALAMFAVVAPGAVAEDTSVREENREFILEHADEYDPNEVVEVHHNGIVEEMTAEEALELTLDRAGDRNLADLAASATHGSSDLVGDVWLLGFGSVDCGETTILQEGVNPFLGLHPQFFLYAGDYGYNEDSSADFLLGLGFTMKEFVLVSDEVNYGGISDFFCFEGSFGVLFPFIDGYSTTEDVPPPLP